MQPALHRSELPARVPGAFLKPPQIHTVAQRLKQQLQLQLSVKGLGGAVMTPDLPGRGREPVLNGQTMRDQFREKEKTEG